MSDEFLVFITRHLSLVTHHSSLLPMRWGIAILVILIFLPQTEVFGWGDVSHMVIAQIAYEQLNNKARVNVDKLIRKIRFRDKTYNFLTAACWMDDLRDDSHYNELKKWHYINKPYFEGIPPRVIFPESNNVLSRTRWNIKTLKAGMGYDQRRAEVLGYLLHLVGDIHQPLHNITRYTRIYNDANGDSGGNEFKIILEGQRIDNLHAYWDEAAGLFNFDRFDCQLDSSRQKRIQKYADEIRSAYPPTQQQDWKGGDPGHWVEESYDLAKTVAYTTPEGQPLTHAYTIKVQSIVRQRIALAGYRLAELLNEIFGKP
jgi:hypothetical protein